MFPDKVIKKVPGQPSKNPNEKQGYIEDINKLSLVEITEILERQKKLLADSYVSSKVGSAVELLNHFSVDELKMILNEGTKFEDVMKDIIDCKDIDTDKEVFLASNKSLAEFNLTKEANMNELKHDIIELSRTGEYLYHEVTNKTNRLSKNSGSNSLEEVVALLQTAAATIEEESESLVESFLNGETDVDSFLETFINKRKLMHMRRVKVDKMIEMVRRRTSRTDVGNTKSLFTPGPHILTQGPTTAPSYPSVNYTPYPLGPVNAMPLPSINKFNNY